MRKKTVKTRRVMGEIMSGDTERTNVPKRKPNMRIIMEMRKRDARDTHHRPTTRCDVCKHTYCAEYVRIESTWNGSFQLCDFCRLSK